MCTLRGAVASRVYSIILRVRLVGPMEPPVGPLLYLAYAVCPSEKGVSHLYRQRKVIHCLKAISDERDKML